MSQTQSIPLPRPETDLAGFVRRALMPDASITAGLVARSALDRIEDLRLLARVVQENDGLAAHRPAWNEALACIDRSAVTRQLAIGSSPLFRRWLHACGRALIEGAEPALLQALLSFVANYVIGLGGDDLPPARLALRDGMLETWDCVGSGAPGDGNDARAVPPFLPQSRIVVRNDLPGLRVSLDETRVPERESAVRHQDVDTRQDSYPQGPFPVLIDAAAALMQAWPQEYEDWQQTLRVVVPRLPPSGWRMEGFTISSMQGAVWINPSEFLMALESLVHEQSHVKLRYLEEMVPLLEPAQTQARFPVGWRTDSRPLVGIYEGVYVHIHCAIALARCLDAAVLDEGYRASASARLAELLQQAREGLEILCAHARFTDAGQGFAVWARESLQHAIS